MQSSIGAYADYKDLVIFGAPKCKYCNQARALLTEIGHPSWAYVNLDTYHPTLKAKLKKMTGQNTIPLIFKKISDTEYEFIHGYAELKARYEPKN